MQMYRVFLNDRAILISEIINTGEYAPDILSVNVTDRPGLVNALDHFFSDQRVRQLNLLAGIPLESLWNLFKSLFVNQDAAGGIVKRRNGDILFIYRLGKWDLPKGKPEKGEALHHTAIREVQEETGLTELEITGVYSPTFHIYQDRKGWTILKMNHWFEMIYSGNEEPAPQLEEDITEARWFRPDQCGEVLKNTYASLRSVIGEALGG
jgi:8-oxo-dGTP pyrophosphatase MutT (NUDIX family)